MLPVVIARNEVTSNTHGFEAFSVVLVDCKCSTVQTLLRHYQA